ncbi:hypothetical protein NSK_007816 [Nannochloropsis salina CCMP1776]|uniref:Uncharacterized protein n=1 Tax=Nannochloropsis salina CCMP1776 TaxID=1027361 RepID=A0A4D9CNX2_9STRA|nr:hypothetical protein NSK_007816 [Nannochloropsis salina CCMP1776]|eukprot:TFJ80861.1 hypothetical protein NSK_007816 [Nannochloropsis salina CCMP1776]
MQRGSIFMRILLSTLIVLASVSATETTAQDASTVAVVESTFTPVEKADVTFLRGTEADKVMCDGVECPKGEMCMRSSSGSRYCMKM